MNWNNLVFNWKTTVAAAIIALGAVMKTLAPNYGGLIDRAGEFLILLGPILGLLAAKDGDRSGTSANPNP